MREREREAKEGRRKGLDLWLGIARSSWLAFGERGEI